MHFVRFLFVVHVSNCRESCVVQSFLYEVATSVLYLSCSFCASLVLLHPHRIAIKMHFIHVCIHYIWVGQHTVFASLPWDSLQLNGFSPGTQRQLRWEYAKTVFCVWDEKVVPLKCSFLWDRAFHQIITQKQFVVTYGKMFIKGKCFSPGFIPAVKQWDRNWQYRIIRCF